MAEFGEALVGHADGGTGNADGGDHAAVIIGDGTRNAADAVSELLIIDRIAAGAGAGDFVIERAACGQRTGSERREGAIDMGIAECQERLAERRAMGGARAPIG